MEQPAWDRPDADGAMREYFNTLPPAAQAALRQSRMPPEDLDALRRAAGRLMSER
ncbi:MAG: hypothetical protein ACOYJY_06605 [Acutalibacteraceae bacterium]|jgi:hypothetical protein